MREWDTQLGRVTELREGDDTSGLAALLDSREALGVDTETTGKRQYAPDFRVRLVTVGTADRAYAFRPQDFPHLAVAAVTSRPVFLHNATFDLLGLQREVGVPYTESSGMAVDTGILSRLYDSRPRKEGGTGHGLDELGPAYCGTDSKTQSKKAMEVHAKKAYGLNKDQMWAGIPDTDELWLQYAGQDAMLTARLGKIMTGKIKADGLGWLAETEHRISQACAAIEHHGVNFDVPYAEAARAGYLARYEAAEAMLRDRFGVVKGKDAKSYNGAAASILERLQDLGAQLTKRTKPSTRFPDGQISLDDTVLAELMHLGGAPGELAAAIAEAKKMLRYADTYLGTCLGSVGVDGRMHFKLNPMGAQTGRMSVNDPPLQQFPRDEPMLRGSVIPDEGHVLVASDFSQIEWRVAAAVTRDEGLLRTIAEGGDIHGLTATAIYGRDYTKAQRDSAKRPGLSWLYGVGDQALADKEGWTLDHAKKIKRGFGEQYPGIQRFVDVSKAQVRAGKREHRTAMGRKLIVEYGHKILNYHCQSIARDIFASALLELVDKGYGGNVRLLVHDEIIMSVPKEDAQQAIRDMDAAMNTEFKGVPIEAQAEIMGERWKK